MYRPPSGKKSGDLGSFGRSMNNISRQSGF